MNDQPHGPYGPQDPYGPRDPYRPHRQGRHARSPYGGPGPQQPGGSEPHDARHQYAPYDPYGPQAPRQPGDAAGWRPPEHSAGHPYERPQTQVWHGLTHQDSGSFSHMPAADGSMPPAASYAQPDPYAAWSTHRQAADPPPAGARAHPDTGPVAAPGVLSRAATGMRAAATGLTPAQQARAEGRSPIIPPGVQPALLTTVLAALIAAGALVGRPLLAVAVALLQAVTAAGWYRLSGMWPARQGIALAFAGGLATDVGLLATGREEAPTVGLGTLGVWCLLVLVQGLRSHSSADERLYALTAGVASTAFAVLAAGFLAGAAVSQGAVVVGATAVAVATVARALRLPPFVSPAVALIAACGAGIAAGAATGLGAPGALLGLAAGGCGLVGLRVASYDYPSRFVHMTAGVALPLAMAAPAVYVLGRALG